VVAGDSLVEVEGTGTVPITVNSRQGKRIMRLEEVLFIPTFQSNLVSFGRLQERGVEWNSRTGELIHHGEHLCFVQRHGRHYLMEYDANTDTGFSVKHSMKPKESTASADLWHRRLGHLGKEAIEHLEGSSRNAYVEGKVSDKCHECHLAKATQIVSRRSPEPSKRPFQKVFFDLIIMKPAYNGDQYACHFVDDFTNYHKVYTFSEKTGVNTAIVWFIAWVQNKYGLTIEAFHTDGETSITNEIIDFVKRRGIEVRISAPYTPAQTGKAERAGKAIIEGGRTMGITAGLPKKLWTEFFHAMAYFLNLMPTERLGWKSPLEVLQLYLNMTNAAQNEISQAIVKAKTPKPQQQASSKASTKQRRPLDLTKPEHAHLKAYGCLGYILRHDVDKADKMEARAYIGYLVGYDSTNIFRLWVPPKGIVGRYRDVKFDETKFYDPNDHEFNRQLGAATSEPEEVEMPEFVPYIPPDDLDIPEPSYTAITWPDEGTDTQAARDRSLPGSQPPEETANMRKQPDLGLFTPETTPEVRSPGPESRETSGGEHTRRNATENDSLGISELFARPAGSTDADGSQPVAQETTVDQPSRLQRRAGPSNTAPRSSEISADPEDPSNILSSRTRGKKARHQEHALLVSQVNQLSGIHTAFHSATRYRLHQSELPKAPEHYSDLKNHPYALEFKNAAREEVQTLRDKGTFEEVPADNTRKLLPLRWVFIYKFDTDGYLSRFKARLCVRGDLQPPSPTETYAATLAARIFRALMALMAAFDLDSCQFDATNAFVNADIDEETYVHHPEGFRRRGFNLRLRKALYGLKQAPRLWHQTFSQTLKAMGLKQVGDEPCLFVNDWLIIFFFVDDAVALFHPSKRSLWEAFKQSLFQTYEFKDMGNIKWFIGIRVIRAREQRKVWLCQDAYIDRIAARFHTLSGKTKYRSPLPVVDLRQYARSPENQASPEAVFAYQQRVGSALYAACLTRPDIARATAHLAEFSVNPDEAHTAAVERVIAYLHNTRTLAIEYSAPTDLSHPVFEVYSDSAFADDETSRRSTSGYLIRLFGGPIDWKSYKQRSVTTSTTEAELHALTEAVRETYYWQRIFRDIGLCLQHDVGAACDNQQTIRLLTSTTPRLVTKLRHVDIKHHWLRQEIQANRIKVYWVPTAKMRADGLTKTLSIQQHEKFVQQLSLVALETVDNDEQVD
jgi:hypothetical protein